MSTACSCTARPCALISRVLATVPAAIDGGGAGGTPTGS